MQRATASVGVDIGAHVELGRPFGSQENLHLRWPKDSQIGGQGAGGCDSWAPNSVTWVAHEDAWKANTIWNSDY